MAKKKNLKVICENCKQITNHEIIKSQRKYEENMDWDIREDKERQIIKCKWCGNYSFRKYSLCSEDIFFDYNGDAHWAIIEIYPKRTLNTIKEREFRYVPSLLKKIYHEIIISYNENCYLLTVIWIRTLLEWICKEEKIKWNTLEKKINSLLNDKIITERISTVLHNIRHLWNEVTHELEILDWLEIRYMIEIMENIIENIYELPNKSQRVIENKKNRIEFENMWSRKK